MLTAFGRTIALLCVLSLVACTSLRPVSEPQQRTDTGARPSLSDLVRPGDRLLVTRTDGTRVALRVTATSAESIDGTETGSAKPVHLGIDDVTRIERRKISGTKTTLLVVGVAAAAAGVAAAAALGELAAGI